MPRITALANDHDVHGKPLRYLGAMLTTEVTRNFRHDLAVAIESDHPNCTANCCDISEALDKGYVYVAAHSLMSATDELPHLHRMLAAHRFNRTIPDDFGSNLYDNADWDGWKEHFDKNARPCDCGSYCFAEPGQYCDNCGNWLGYRIGDEVTFDRNVNHDDLPYEQVTGKVVAAVLDEETRNEPIWWLDIEVDEGNGPYILYQIRSDYI